ncbi:hypothetical protein REH65_19665 [Saccharopolyspora sp. ID03-671]|uniref:hypothetical protein n=1 Tax=Saccharopolyspora sp. ID03-671 TaxID=3073066 RepID=UPI003246442D
MSNPLVEKQPESDDGFITKGTGDQGWAAGIGIAESVNDVSSLNEGSSWVESGLAYGGLALEGISMAVDPIGTLLSYGLSWLIEHVQPLKEALDWFAGDPDGVAAYGKTWENVSKAVEEAASQYEDAVKADTADWTGAAGDAYRRTAAEKGEALAGAAKLAGTISSVVTVMGEVVAFVREFVRDLVADCISRLITYALEALLPPIASLAWVVPQAVAFISKTVSKIADVVNKLIKTISNVSPKLAKLAEVFGDIMKTLGGKAKAGAGAVSKVAEKLDVAEHLAAKSWKKIDETFGTDVVGRHNARFGGPDSPNAPDSGDDGGSPSAEGGRSSSQGDASTRSGSTSDGGSQSEGASGAGSAQSGSSSGGSGDSGSGASGDPGSSGSAQSRSSSDSPSAQADSVSSHGDAGSQSRSSSDSGQSGSSSADAGPQSRPDSGSAQADSGSSHADAASQSRTDSGSAQADSGSSRSNVDSGSQSGSGSTHSGSGGATHTDAPRGDAGSPSAQTHTGSGVSTPDAQRAPANTSAAGVDAPARPPEAAAPQSAPSAPRPDQPSSAAPGGAASPSAPSGGSPSGGAPSPRGAGRQGSPGWTGTSGHPGAAHTPNRPHADAPNRPAASRGDAPNRPAASRADAPNRPHVDAPSRPRVEASAHAPRGGRGAPSPSRASQARPGAPVHRQTAAPPRPEHLRTAEAPRTPIPAQRTPEAPNSLPDQPKPDQPKPSTAESMAAETPPKDSWQAGHHKASHTPRLDISDELREKLGPRRRDIEANTAGLSFTRPPKEHYFGRAEWANKRPRCSVDPNRFTVEMHGGPNGVRFKDLDLDAKELAEIIKGSPGYKDGTPIRLVSCETGADVPGGKNFAQQLSEELGVEVLAPNSNAWVDNYGNIYASETRANFDRDESGTPHPRMDSPGEWTAFRPDGTKAVHTSPYPPGHNPEWTRGGVQAEAAQRRGFFRRRLKEEDFAIDAATGHDYRTGPPGSHPPPQQPNHAYNPQQQQAYSPQQQQAYNPQQQYQAYTPQHQAYNQQHQAYNPQQGFQQQSVQPPQSQGFAQHPQGYAQPGPNQGHPQHGYQQQGYPQQGPAQHYAQPNAPQHYSAQPHQSYQQQGAPQGYPQHAAPQNSQQAGGAYPQQPQHVSQQGGYPQQPQYANPQYPQHAGYGSPQHAQGGRPPQQPVPTQPRQNAPQAQGNPVQGGQPNASPSGSPQQRWNAPQSTPAPPVSGRATGPQQTASHRPVAYSEAPGPNFGTPRVDSGAASFPPPPDVTPPTRSYDDFLSDNGFEQGTLLPDGPDPDVPGLGERNPLDELDFFGDRDFRATAEDHSALRQLGKVLSDAELREIRSRRPDIEHITDEELSAMYLYTGMDHQYWNEALRGGDVEEVRRYETVIRNAVSGMNKLPDWTATPDVPTVHRGIFIDSWNMEDFLERYSDGAEVTENAFTSSSKGDPFPGNVEFVIEAREGKDLEFLKPYGGMREVAWPPGSRFAVSSRKFDEETDKWTIYLTDLGR